MLEAARARRVVRVAASRIMRGWAVVTAGTPPLVLPVVEPVAPVEPVELPVEPVEVPVDAVALVEPVDDPDAVLDADAAVAPGAHTHAAKPPPLGSQI